MKSLLLRLSVLFIVFFPLFSQPAFSQRVLISDQAGVPDPSSLLELRSSSGGLLLPRLSQTERNNLTNPTSGLVIYNTTSSCLQIYMPQAGWRSWICDCPNSNRNFISGPSTAFGGSPISFAGNIAAATYNWTFSGGTPANSTSANPTVTFNSGNVLQITATADSAGCTFFDTVQVTLQTNRNCSTIKAANPSLASGIYNIDPDGAGGVAPFNCFCDMTSDGGGWASIFQLSGSLSLTSRTCLFSYSNDDHDSYLMWSNLENRISTTNTNSTNGSFMTIDRNGTANTASSALTPRPAGIGTDARPLPFPGSNQVIWFDWQNGNVLWGTQSVTMTSLGITPSWFNSTGNNFYLISDGVDVAMVGSQSSASARILRFNFVNNTVVGQTGVHLNLSNWHGTEEDAFGHVLYTVNGKIFHYNASGSFRLAGTMGNPNVTTSTWSVTWNLGVDTQHGVDFFGHVDNSGFLWFADWGHDNGGFFNCGNDDQMGVARSNITLTY
jgi:hypothetical protein